MNAAIAFRQAQPADVPAIVRLVESAYRGDASRIGWTTEADFLEGQRIDALGVQNDIHAPHSIILLAELASIAPAATPPSTRSATDNLLACCHLQKRESICYFGMFSVAPNQQGSGIGKAMMAEAERYAEQTWQCTRMEMTVIDIRQELIDFYLRRGYRRTGNHLPFPYGDERFGLPLRDDLRFEILDKPLAAP